MEKPIDAEKVDIEPKTHATNKKNTFENKRIMV
jgi:hypothetical protein